MPYPPANDCCRHVEIRSLVGRRLVGNRKEAIAAEVELNKNRGPSSEVAAELNDSLLMADGVDRPAERAENIGQKVW